MKQICLAALFLLLVTTTASCKPLELVSTEFAPYVFTEKGQIRGVNVDLLKAIFKQMNMEIHIKIIPWARALYILQNGYADAVFPLFKTRERTLYTDYSDAFTTENTSLFVLKNAPIQWNGNLNDLSGYRFGRVRGYSSGPKIDRFIKNNTIRLDEVNKTENNIKKLLAGRFDIMIEAEYVALFELQKMGRSDDVRMLAVIQKNLSYLGFSKKRKHLSIISRFNEILKKMKKDGTYQRIVDNFFQNSPLK